jgi:hypothetical protein
MSEDRHEGDRRSVWMNRLGMGSDEGMGRDRREWQDF